jgi:hypothetical protein
MNSLRGKAVACSLVIGRPEHPAASDYLLKESKEESLPVCSF